MTPKPGQTPTRDGELVNEEIDKIVKDGVTPRELARALNSRRASFLDQIASVLGKSDRLAEYNYFAGTPDYIQQDAARYDQVTAADVQRVAAKYLTKPKVVLTVVPEGKTDLMVTGGAQLMRACPHALPDTGGAGRHARCGRLRRPAGRNDERARRTEAVVSGTPVDLTKPPALGPPPALRLPPVTTRTLPNGLKLVVVEQHELPLVDVVLDVRTGGEADPAGKSARPRSPRAC